MIKDIAKIFKHIFIPHIHNDYRPHFFREMTVISITVFLFVLLIVSIGTRIYINKTDMKAAVLPSVLVDLTNKTRLLNNESTLIRNSILDNAAKLKAEDMASSGYFAHTSPSGVTPWYWFGQVGYSFSYAGENLAIDFTESLDVENAWLNSPTHKANILNSNFKEIGIATAEGFRNGKPTTYVVQMFGSPLVSASTNVSTQDKLATSQKPSELNNIDSIRKPQVKGESISNNIETIIDTEEFTLVRNTEAIEDINQIITEKNDVQYSTWYQKILFFIPNYTDKTYHIIAWVVLIALFLVAFIEIKLQHPKNIIYGLLLLIIIFCFIFINKTVFATFLLM